MLNKKYLNKRGFAIQFNWLFVLVGGAIFLGFFISLINNQLSAEETRTIRKATKELDSLLRVSLASDNTHKTVAFDKKIVFYCKDISEYYVEGALVSARYDYNAIFSPAELEGKELIIQTLIFEAPYRTMPVVYVTNKDIEYVFIANSSVISQIYHAMPANVTKKIIRNPSRMAGYKDNNYDHTVFILDVRNQSLLTRIPDFDSRADWRRVYAVVINTSGGSAYTYGNLVFFSYNPNENPSAGFISEGSLPFLGFNLLLGAVISHDITIYNCTLRKILQRIELLSTLHRERMVYYGDNAEGVCEFYYSDPGAGAEKYLSDIRDYSAGEISLHNFINLFVTLDKLASLNRYIQTGTDRCPLIY